VDVFLAFFLSLTEIEAFKELVSLEKPLKVPTKRLHKQ